MPIKIISILWMLISFAFSGMKVGDEAPTFYAKTLDGRSFFLSDSLEKNPRPRVFSFFATWCGPCRLEMPVIDSLSHVYENVDFYLVNVSGLKGKKKQDPTEVKELLTELFWKDEWRLLSFSSKLLSCLEKANRCT